MNALPIIATPIILRPTYDNTHVAHNADLPLWMADNEYRLKSYFALLRDTQPADETPFDWFDFLIGQHTDEQMRLRIEREIA